MKSPKDYWDQYDFDGGDAASNSSLFRFFGSNGLNFKGKRVLEIGFWRGGDLLEAQRRGAEIYGIDINAAAVENMQMRTGLQHFAVADCGREPIRFDGQFDAIFALDMISYLSDDEIAYFGRNCFEALAQGGLLVVHFIQRDFVRGEKNAPHASFALNDWVPLDGTFAKNNPIRILDISSVKTIFESHGGQLVATKTVCETFGNAEDNMRSYRYLMFSKQNQ